MIETYETSPSIAGLAKSLAAAQGRIRGAIKDSANPFYKSKYADLASCWDACRGPLSDNMLAVLQVPINSADGTITLVTTLAHDSGEWVRGVLSMTPKDASPQAAGSAITYARRYAFAAIVGIAQMDDDGNAASGKDPAAKDNFHDPRGEAYKSVDAKTRDSFVNRVMSALTADKDEREIADDLYELHLDLIKDSEMYTAVGAQLSAKDRKAFKTFVDLAKAAAKPY